MGVTAMIPNMTFQQLKDEANSRWQEIWDGNAARLEVMLLCPRKERKLLELHGDMIDHGTTRFPAHPSVVTRGFHDNPGLRQETLTVGPGPG